MKNLPNILTVSRIILSILLLAILLHGEQLGFYQASLCSFIVFALASITDFFDGYLARKYHLTSVFGEVFDPLADKMLILSAFIGLILTNEANPWLVFIILSREFFITGLRVVAASNNQDIKAGILGKCKTVLQGIAICFLLLHAKGGELLLWIAMIVTLYSGFDYAWHYYKKIK